ncbi:MAG: glycosyltransferase [Anaerolineae bacterium]
MRIAMLSFHTSPLAALGGKDTGGMNVYVRELSRQLGRRGLAVDIFTRRQDFTTPVVEHPWEGVRVLHLAAGPQAPMDRRQLFVHLPEFVQGLRDVAACEGTVYDVIHSHYWLSGWAALQLRDQWAAPVVHMFHTLGVLKSASPAGPQAPEARERSRVEADIICEADRIVAATPADREQMVQFYGADPQRIRVVPPGVDLELFRPVPRAEARRFVGLTDPEERLLLFVGRLDPVKGLNVLFEALCHLLRRLAGQQRISLVVIGGDTPESGEVLREEAVCLDEVRERYGLNEMVAFLGSRSQDTLPYYYSAADLCVMPSLYESFGMVALEAMACGTPVVASRVGGLPHVVRDGETGLLVPENDPEALAYGLHLLLTDESLRRRLGARGLEVAQEYCWECVAEQIEDLYREEICAMRPLSLAGRGQG